MTLQNGLVHGRKAYLWCDTAWWNTATGELVCMDSKAFSGACWPFAGTLSTWGDDPHLIVKHLGRLAPVGLDHLLTAARAVLREFSVEGRGGRLLLASYDIAPRLHMIASDKIWQEVEPFEPVEIDHFTSSGNDTAAYRVAAAKGFNPKRMRRVIDAQCVTPFAGVDALAGLGDRVWIGGNVVRLEVGAEGVTSAVERAV